MNTLPTYQEISKLTNDLKADIPDLISYAESQIDQGKLKAAGLELTPSNARVIGYFGGVAPGVMLGGAEAYQMVLYDKETGKSGVYLYYGATLGPNISVPGLGLPVGGVVIFDGSLDDISGLSGGFQGSAGASVGWATDLPGRNFNMVQVGGSASLAAEVTLGYTWDISSPTAVNIDWALAERTINSVYADDEAAHAQAMASLSLAKSIPSWQEAFIEKYGAIISLGARCFPAGTLITLANNAQKPIEDIRHGDIVLSHDKNGNLVPAIVDKLFTNTTDAFIRLSFTDGREDLIATPGHHFLTEAGDYMEIGHMARLCGGNLRLVDTDGSILSATAERLEYSAKTADLFEQSQTKTIAFSGSTTLIRRAA